MEMAESSANWSIRVLAINADGTKRLSKLRGDNITTGLADIFQEANNGGSGPLVSIVTISEMSRISDLDAIASTSFGKSWKVEKERLNGYDGIATAYNSDVWEVQGPRQVSNTGRYLATKLRNKLNGRVLLYFSVHLPHIKNKSDAYSALRKAIRDLAKGVDAVMIGGDWNMEPQEIIAEFSLPTCRLDEAQLAFVKDGNTGESKNREAIDNFLFISSTDKDGAARWKVEFTQKMIMREFQKDHTTHAPISAVAEISKNHTEAAKEDTRPPDSEAAKEDTRPPDSEAAKEDTRPPDSETAKEDTRPADSEAAKKDTRPADSEAASGRSMEPKVDAKGAEEQREL